MNWTKQIKFILGKLWTWLFGEQEFIQAILAIEALYCHLMENRHRNWRSSQIAASKASYPVAAPYAIYLSKDARRPVANVDQILNNQKAIGAPDATGGWILESLEEVREPWCIRDHILGSTHTWLKGIDFTVLGNQYYFNQDPATFGWPVVVRLDAAGNPKQYYRVFGTGQKPATQHQMITGFFSKDLEPCADLAWDMHQNGVTLLNMKQMLGRAVDSAVCVEGGNVDNVWQEQDLYCCLIAGHVYSSRKPMNVETGDSVETGAILSGSMKAFTGNDTPSSTDVPGIRVMTDAGELTAANTDMDADTVVTESGTVSVLPLRNGTSPSQAYQDICAANSQDIDCPAVEVPETVNPYRFIMNTIRNGRSVAVRLVMSNARLLAAAIQCIRKHVSSSAMVNVYVQAEADVTVSVASSFEAYAGTAAVAVDATVTVRHICTEAEVFL